MVKQTFIYDKLHYIFWHPASMKEGRTYPTLIFCHGAGSRGPDSNALWNNPFFTQTEKYMSGAIVFAPRCDADSWFDIYEQLNAFIDYILQQTFADTNRIYLMGASMGGYAVWQLAMSRPNLFAAIVPICGGGMYWNASKLKNLPIWAFHGDRDDVVFPEESRKMVDAVNHAGGNAKLTVCKDVCHDSWLNAYNSKELFDWLFAQEKTNTEAGK